MKRFNPINPVNPINADHLAFLQNRMLLASDHKPHEVRIHNPRKRGDHNSGL